MSQTLDLENLQPWFRVKLGTYQSSAELSRTLFDKGCQETDDSFNAIDVAQEVVELPLVLLRATQLGIRKRPSKQRIFAAALQTGKLSVCPVEVVPQLWLQLPDELRNQNKRMLIAHESINCSCADNPQFGIEDGCVYTMHNAGHLEFRWDAKVTWIFVLNGPLL